jgi:type I restriction enzyme S subunit
MGDCYLLSAKNIKNGFLTIEPEQERIISKDELERINKRIKLEKYDVLLTSVGTVGETAIILDDNINYVFQRSVAIFKPNPEKILPEYLYYIFRSKDFKEYLIMNTTGAAQPCLFLGFLQNIKVELVEMEKQIAICNALRPFIKQINLLRKQGNTLEKEFEMFLPRIMSGKLEV